MSRPFPNEIFDAIISRVPSRMGWPQPEDRETLLNCTLVCRDWLPASRHTLFSSCVLLSRPDAWDSFLRCVVNVEEGLPWLASIVRLQIEDRWYTYYDGDRKMPTRPISERRAQYIIPVLAGHLPNLKYLSLSVDWDQCRPHPATFGMFSQFTSLRELRLSTCRFPSFCTFRRILISLPALKALRCDSVHWPSTPQPSILVIPSAPLALHALEISSFCTSCSLAMLEWLIHTPTRSTVLELSLVFYSLSPDGFHPFTLPLNRTLDYYVQIFAPSLHSVRFGHVQDEDNIANNISDLSRFREVKFLEFGANAADWRGTADLLQSLPAQLETLVISVGHGQTLLDSNRMVKEDSEVKTSMKTNGLELLEPVLLRDNFNGLRYLEFQLWGYRDTLEPLEESIIQTIWQKLPKLHSRTTLDIRLHCDYITPLPLPSPASDHAAQLPV